MVGAPKNGNGTVEIYEVAPNGTLTSSGSIASSSPNSGFGTSVAATGDYLLVGAPMLHIAGTPTEAGGIFLYTKDQESKYRASGFKIQLDDETDVLAANGELGSSVSMTIIGQTLRMVVGAPGTTGGNVDKFVPIAGRFFVYECILPACEAYATDPKAKTIGEAENDRLGASVAISKDGSTMLIGAPSSSADKPGYVLVYKYDISNIRSPWKLDATLKGESAGDMFGSDVHFLTDNGERFAVGSPGALGGAGMVQAFSRDDSGDFARLGNPMLGVVGNQLGTTNSIGGSGDHVIAGTSSGTVHRYDLTESLQWDEIYKAANIGFENPMAVSSFGDRIAVGVSKVDYVTIIDAERQVFRATKAPTMSPAPTKAPTVTTTAPDSASIAPTANSTSSESLVPSLSPTELNDTAPSAAPSVILRNWTRTGGPFRLDLANSGFGSSLAFLSDSLIVGAPQALSSAGALLSYSKSGANWSEAAQEFGAKEGGVLGYSLDGAGSFVAAGAVFEPAVHVYQYRNGAFLPAGKSALGQVAGGFFGSSVAVSSNGVLLVGASGEGSASEGAVHMLTLNSDVWTEQAAFAGNKSGAGLGSAVDLDSGSGKLAVAGAPNANQATVYEEIGSGSWREVVTLSGEGGFGSSVKVISGSRFAIGAPKANGNTGRVHVYSKSGDVVEQVGLLEGQTGEQIAGIGMLAGVGNSLIVGNKAGKIVRYDDNGSGTFVAVSEELDSSETTSGLLTIATAGSADVVAISGSTGAGVYTLEP